MIQVRVVKLGDAVQQVTLPDGATVRDALVATGVYYPVPDGHQVRRNQNACQLTDTLVTGDIITLVPKVSAG